MRRAGLRKSGATAGSGGADRTPRVTSGATARPWGPLRLIAVYALSSLVFQAVAIAAGLVWNVHALDGGCIPCPADYWINWPALPTLAIMCLPGIAGFRVFVGLMARNPALERCRCVSCGARLRGLNEPRCPECGEPI